MNHQMVRIKIDKLVRDHSGGVLRAKGIHSSERVMELSEYKIELASKLLEEAKEAIAAKDEDEIMEELSDLLEVMVSILNVYGKNFEDLEKRRLQKQAVKGGFEARIYCSHVDMRADNENLSYYRRDPQRYPEIDFKVQEGNFVYPSDHIDKS